MPAWVTKALTDGWPRTSFWGAHSTTLMLEARFKSPAVMFPAHDLPKSDQDLEDVAYGLMLLNMMMNIL